MLHSVEKPDNSKLTYGYDAADRLTSVTDLPGNSIVCTLDALGDKTQTQWKDTTPTVQRTTTATFDALGRMTTYTGGMSQATDYTYDKNGNVLSVDDGVGNTVTNTFDALNRLKTAADPSPGGTTTYTYDAHDRVTNVSDPLNHSTAYTYDGFGDKIQVVSPDSDTTVLYYNPDRDLTKQILAGSLEADMTYDTDDRLTGTSYPSDSTLTTTLTYDQTHGDGIGRLTSATDKTGTLSLTYDERGNVTAESRVLTGITTLNTSYTFDNGNNLSGITYPSGTVVAYGRNSMGRVTSVTAQPPGFGSPSNVVTGVTYEPFGPATGLTCGNGITGTYAYDADYRATSRADVLSGTNVMNLAYTYDAADNLKTITDAVTAANGQTLGYDALNRISTAVSGTGGYGSWSWTWDKAHNASTQVIAGTTTTYNHASGTNEMSSAVTGSTTVNYTDTAAGSENLLKIGSSTIATLTWNAANQLASAAAGGTASYAYDLFGRRLEKTPSGGNTIAYQYAGLSPSLLLSENDAHSNQADYIYMDGRPIGEVNPSSGALYFTHTDTLGTPQMLTNSIGTVVWSATYKPFGNTQTTAGSIVQNLRLPGQYFDTKTGYMNNGFRVYDANGTRYLSVDPIGLAGGINPFQYVRGNPFKNVDPLGLTTAVEDPLDPTGGCAETECPQKGGFGVSIR